MHKMYFYIYFPLYYPAPLRFPLLSLSLMFILLISVFFYDPLSAAHMHMGVRSSTGMWTAYQNHVPKVNQLPLS